MFPRSNRVAASSSVRRARIESLESRRMLDGTLPQGLLAVNVGGDFFGRGETYYLTPDQRSLLQSEPASSGDEGHPNFIQSFLNLFH